MSTPTTSHLIEKETDGYIEKPTAWKKGINTKEMKTFYNGKLKPTTLRKYFSSPTSPLIEGIIIDTINDILLQLDHHPNDRKFVEGALIHFQKKIEENCVERCLKCEPITDEYLKYEPGERSRRIFVDTFNFSKEKFISAIKKEFNKE